MSIAYYSSIFASNKCIGNIIGNCFINIYLRIHLQYTKLTYLGSIREKDFGNTEVFGFFWSSIIRMFYS